MLVREDLISCTDGFNNLPLAQVVKKAYKKIQYWIFRILESSVRKLLGKWMHVQVTLWS